MKRKSEEIGKKRSKKMKFDRLDGGRHKLKLPASWKVELKENNPK